MWNGDLWVLYVSSYKECGLVGPIVCSYEEYGLVGPVYVFLCGMWTCGSCIHVFLCGMWTCGSSVCAPVWGGDLWVL